MEFWRMILYASCQESPVDTWRKKGDWKKEREETKKLAKGIRSTLLIPWNLVNDCWWFTGALLISLKSRKLWRCRGRSQHFAKSRHPDSRPPVCDPRDSSVGKKFGCTLSDRSSSSNLPSHLAVTLKSFFWKLLYWWKKKKEKKWIRMVSAYTSKIGS